jgi:hypothetical protein
MTRFYYSLALAYGLFLSFQSNAQRYVSEVFTDVTVTQDVQYANNISVLTGAPASEILVMDVYEPTGDTETERPVILIAHGGEYLPNPLNGLTYGEKTDSAVVHLCTTLAKRGFVAVAYTYRLGWNPVGNQEERTGTYLNAHYRGVQDGFSAVRFLRLNAATQGNSYGIDTTRIISGGMGTGGQISASMAFLDRHAEFELPKFLNPLSSQSYIDTSLSGNVYGTETRPLTIANNAAYSNEIHFAFNLGGYVLDSTWIEAGDVPMVSLSSPTDPYSPYDFGPAIVRTTADFLVNCSGSKGIQRKQNEFGNNDPFSTINYTDSYTAQANLMNDGLDGLYPFNRPGFEDSPWHWWDTITWNVPHPSGGTFNDNGYLTNPDMSAAKGKAYLDTVVNYLCPRIVCALSLPGCPNTGLEEVPSQESFVVYPNPSQGEFTLILNNTSTEKNIQITDLNGRVVFNQRSNGQELNVDLHDSGVFVITVSSDFGVSRQRIILH